MKKKNQKPPITWTEIFYKTYPRFPQKELEPKNLEGKISPILNNRQSTNSFSGEPPNYEDFSSIIYWSMGRNLNHDPNRDNRKYPSAGARYPVELYVEARNIEGLDKGIYHYNIRDNSFEKILSKKVEEGMKKSFGESIDEKRAATLMLTGVLSRSEIKYGSEAYRFSLLESGHIGQNLYLTSSSLNLGISAIGKFNEKEVTKLLDIQEHEIPLYSLVIGRNNKSL